MRLHILIFLFIVSAISIYGQATDYIGFWSLNGHADDNSSNAFHGYINGAVQDPGHDPDDALNTSMYFDGVDDYIELDYPLQLQFGTGSFSIAFWMKPDVNSNVRLINNRGTGSGGLYSGYQIKIHTDGSNWYFYDAGIDDATGNYKSCNNCGSSHPCNQWYHVTMVYEADFAIKFYVNGEVDAIVSVGQYNSIDNSLPTVFGASLAASGVYDPITLMSQNYKGNLDDIYIFDRTLSEAEISWLAEKMVIGFDYDAAGNRIWKHISLGTGEGSKSARKHQQPVIEDSIQIAQINLYPNPTEGKINIQIIQEEEIQKASVNVYNSSGRIIYSRKMYEMEETIDLSDQMPGLFLITVNVNDQQYVWRVIKK